VRVSPTYTVFVPHDTLSLQLPQWYYEENPEDDWLPEYVEQKQQDMDLIPIMEEVEQELEAQKWELARRKMEEKRGWKMSTEQIAIAWKNIKDGGIDADLDAEETSEEEDTEASDGDGKDIEDDDDDQDQDEDEDELFAGESDEEEMEEDSDEVKEEED
jgi:hypothetical protein